MNQALKLVLAIVVSIAITSWYWNWYRPESSNNSSTSPVKSDIDISGVWQALNTAHWDIEPHNARQGKVIELGALGAIPASLGIVEGEEIPYRAEALAIRNENREHSLERDPLVKCMMPGIPRANYLPFPFHIVQSDDYILFSYEFASASRIVTMNQPSFEALAETWMGHSLGHWEDGTLVITVTDQVADTWLDHSGNYHSEQLQVVERFTPENKNLIWYEAEITDPEVYTRPWTIKFPLYRRMEPDIQLLEFKCVEFVEELLYGDLVVPTPDFDLESNGQ